MAYFKNRISWKDFRDFTGTDNKNYRAIQEHKISKDVWDLYSMDTEGRYTRLLTVDLQGMGASCYNIFRQYERARR
jgi:hypothetical protein